MAGEYQKELFGEFTEEKGKFKKIADKMTQRQQRLYIHMSLENMVFAAIIAIMCIIAAFALGVERGKRLQQPQVVTVYVPKTEPVREPVVEIHKPYTIQLISYRQKERAEGEKDKLLDKNINAFLIQSGSWYQVCTGAYENTNEAKAAMEGFRKDYKGCFIRKN